MLDNGMKADDPRFGIEPERYHGLLITKKGESDAPGVVFSGTIPSTQGAYMYYYRDLVAAIRGETELVVKPEESRAGITIIELALESSEKGVTVPWSEGPY